MAGLYIHIPFCKKACAYCNFHFNTNTESKSDVVKAIINEIELRKNEISTHLETIYFGGGTPSILSNDELVSIFDSIKKHFNLSICKEITFEVNPDDVNPKQLEFWYSIGINRLSMGVQSFFEADLKYMGRFHKANESIQAIKDINASSFTNYTIDLIYGSPTLSDEMWKENLAYALKNKIPHISSYALTVEPNTKLEYRINKAKQKKPLDDDAARQFNILKHWAKENGYNHYEISNLSLPHCKAVHNSNYWIGKPYLGVGPSAHSFDGKYRKWNIANNRSYISKIDASTTAFEQEELSVEDKFNETIMIGFRTKKGVNIKHLKTTFGENQYNVFLDEINKMNQNYFEINEAYIALRPKYWMLSDGIISDLFWINNQ